MANSCSNFITTDNEKVINVFKRLAKKEKKTKEGQTLKYFKDHVLLCELVVEEGHLFCETRWVPPINTVVNLAKKYDCVIEMDYDEPGCLLYGKIIADKAGYTEYALSDEDWDLFEYDEDKDAYLFEGEYWDSENDIKDIIIERKFKI